MTDWLKLAQQDPALMEDFYTLCSFGGRLSGSGQDDAAIDWAMSRLRRIGADATKINVPYDGWHCIKSRLTLLGARPVELAVKPLLRSLSTPCEGVEGDVLDLGQGRTEDFERAGAAVRGKIVLVRHEYPFAPQHMHRRRKYDLANAMGAIGFLIANPLEGRGLLSGSSGRPKGGPGIPAAYIEFEGARELALAAQQGAARVRLIIDGIEKPDALAPVAILDLPGGTDERVVISAHMDGHDMGESALDNASGVVVALAAARALAPWVSDTTHGLRICFFSAEEWALAGSARYLADMSEEERARLKLNINLDTVAGDDTLTALISDFPELDGFVADSAAIAGAKVGTWLPLMANSDHANFAKHGIPALRLVAGFDRPSSRVNNILSPGDVTSVVHEEELRHALRVTCAMGWQGLRMPSADLSRLARRTAG
jgi:aminopeptidase YwaD